MQEAEMMTDDAVAVAPSAEAVGRRLSRIGTVERKLEILQSEFDQAVDAIRRRYDPRLSALRARLAKLRGELESFCRLHRGAVMPPNRKTLQTAFGRVGFRKAELAVCRADGLCIDEVCRRLRRARLSGLVRTSHRLDKTAVRRLVALGRVSPEDLAQYGLAVAQPPDSFRYRLRREPAEVGAGGEGARR
jgi:phage host-nuclease inhibitor protein Gam